MNFQGNRSAQGNHREEIDRVSKAFFDEYLLGIPVHERYRIPFQREVTTEIQSGETFSPLLLDHPGAQE